MCTHVTPGAVLFIAGPKKELPELLFPRLDEVEKAPKSTLNNPNKDWGLLVAGECN
jgi:hypothetical protein